MLSFPVSARLVPFLVAVIITLLPLSGAFAEEAAQRQEPDVTSAESQPELVPLQESDEASTSGETIGTEVPEPQPMSSGTMQFLSRENCYDMWTYPCSYNVPTGQCSTNPAGTPCALGTSCWFVISAGWADSYTCV